MGEVARTSLLILSFLILGGGAFGFVKAKSKASLIAGLVSSVVLDICFAIAMTNLHTGLISGLVACVLLVIMFSVRLAKTRKFMPSGLLLLLCIGEIVLISAGLNTQ